ncbi:MAG TPA: MHYT domain-containing protein [Caulobacteraceae bacterium]|nr:MHYT domain-containing protein [Caulobacteraceae bacterium]
MFRTLICITQQHNPWLLAVAVLVCLIAAATTIRLYSHGRGAGGRRSLPWLVGAGASGGAGIWATHFISMLAYEPGLPTGYGVFGTIASLAIATCGVAIGLIVAARAKGPSGAAAGGLIVGLTISGMHYAGMAAFRTQGFVLWDPAYVTVAIGSGLLFSALALVVASARPAVWRTIGGGVLLVLAIVGVHFVSMAAVTIIPNTRLKPPEAFLPSQAMALAVGSLSALILIGAATMLVLETRGHRRSLAQLNAVIDAMPDGLAYFDADDRYLLWNDRYAAIVAEFGLKPERGRSYVDCVIAPIADASQADAATRAAYVAEQVARRARASATREERSPAGRWIRVEENRTADGGRVTVIFDISSLKQTAQDLAEARDAAEDANRAKSEFLANMSHEIRTPLNGVLGVADALALGTLDERQRELVEIIRTSGQVLNGLLCDILDLARVESGRLVLAPEPFELAQALRDVAALSTVHAEEKGLVFRLSLPDEAERWVMGDPMRLKQILTNLTSNALKFTEAGEVELAAICLDADAGAFRISVRDTGCGFSDEVKARLFGRFQQGDGAMTRRAGGSGLGLSIAHELAALMGGTLGAESVEGEGSVFALEIAFPSAEPQAAAVAPDTTEADDDGGRAMRVLIVDDNANNRRLLEVLLDHVGAETRSAEDGKAAIEAWRAGAFDAIVMDMQMPVMDGLAATRAIRADERASGRARTPIVFVSANAMPEHVEAARAAGGDGHIAKPIAAAALFEALSTASLAAAA